MDGGPVLNPTMLSQYLCEEMWKQQYFLAEEQVRLERLVGVTTVEKMARKLCNSTGKEMSMWKFFIPAILGMLDILEEQPIEFVSGYMNINPKGRIAKDWKEMIQAIRAEHNVGRKP